jgi:hypothetical protein
MVSLALVQLFPENADIVDLVLRHYYQGPSGCAQEAASYKSEMLKLNTRLFELKTMALGMHPSSCAEALQVTSTKILLIMHEADALLVKFSHLPGVPKASEMPPEFFDMAARGSAIASRSQSNVD